MPHDEVLIDRAVAETDIARRSEPRGEDQALRAGRVGDWRRRFGLRDAWSFERLAGEALRETGYEPDPALVACAAAALATLIGQGRRCATTSPCSDARRSAISDRWQASGSRSTHNSAEAASAGSSATSEPRSTWSRISRV